MSTRCNIVVKIGKTVTYLYRHCDGYLAETGADIVTKLDAALGTPEYRRTMSGAACEFLRAVLAETYEQQSYEKKPRHVYEVTTDLHGDIEHAYYITFQERFTTGSVSIRHAARPRGWSDENMEVEDWTKDAKRYNVPAFREAVNQDRRESNVRIAQLRKDNPGSHWEKCDDYAMV